MVGLSYTNVLAAVITAGVIFCTYVGFRWLRALSVIRTEILPHAPQLETLTVELKRREKTGVISDDRNDKASIKKMIRFRGSADAEHCVVIFQGRGNDMASYFPIQEALADRGVASVAWSYAGAVEWAASRRKNKDVVFPRDEFLSFVQEGRGVVEAVLKTKFGNGNTKVHLLGHSWGGPVAFNVAFDLRGARIGAVLQFDPASVAWAESQLKQAEPWLGVVPLMAAGWQQRWLPLWWLQIQTYYTGGLWLPLGGLTREVVMQLYGVDEENASVMVAQLYRYLLRDVPHSSFPMAKLLRSFVDQWTPIFAAARRECELGLTPNTRNNEEGQKVRGTLVLHAIADDEAGWPENKKEEIQLIREDAMPMYKDHCDIYEVGQLAGVGHDSMIWKNLEKTTERLVEFMKRF